MKIALLSCLPNCYSTSRLREAAEARGHDIHVINYNQCYMQIDRNQPNIFYEGKLLENFDAVIPRIGASSTFYGCSVLRQFEAARTYVLNSALAIARSRDKLRALQLLTRKGLALPTTIFSHGSHDIQHLIQLVGGTPLIVKLLQGKQGIGVMLIQHKKEAENIIETFFQLKASFLIQEYIQEAKGADLRCFVIGNKVVASMKRQAKNGDFRANIHRGGSAESVKLTKEERATALLAAKTMGLHVAGVDILRSSRGPLILEVNSSPGLEGIEKATGENIAEEIIKYLEKDSILPGRKKNEG